MVSLLHRLAPGLLLAAACAPAAPPEEYRFWLDGEPIDPEILALVGEPGAPAAGDVVCIGPIRRRKLVLDEAGEYRFVTTERGNLRREYADGRAPLVHVVLGREFEVTASPGELRGVRVEDGWREYAEVLDSAPVERCMIEVIFFADAGSIPRFSERSAYLDLCYADGDPAGLGAELPNLRYLELAIHLGDTDVGRSEEDGRAPRPIDWVADLSDLRFLSVAGTGVRDLRPLGGHPSLRHLLADDTPIEFLPTVALPELRRFEAMDWKCSEQEVGRFRALQPEARIVVGPTERLRDRLEDAAGLRVERQNTLRSDGSPVPPLYVTDDRREVVDLVSLLRFEDEYSAVRGYVPAATNLQLQFLNERGGVTHVIGFFPPNEQLVRGHDLIGVREKRIPPDVRDALAAWFADRGVQLFR